MKNKNSQNSSCRKSVEKLMHEQAKYLTDWRSGTASYSDVYGSFVTIANAASKCAAEESIRQIEKQINKQVYGDYKRQLNIIK